MILIKFETNFSIREDLLTIHIADAISHFLSIYQSIDQSINCCNFWVPSIEMERFLSFFIFTILASMFLLMKTT